MPSKNQEEFKFNDKIELENTEVKQQANTSTCWSFSTISFLESEILRMGNKPRGTGPLNLSEMFVVRKAYPRKARQYVRMHGTIRFGATSLAGDALHVVRNHGLVPEGVYDGKFCRRSQHNHQHNHAEMDAALKGILDAIISKKGAYISRVWPKTIESILDIYLGRMPKSFTIGNTTHTPISFAKKLKIKPDDYIEISSFTHTPFDKKFVLKVPDNWGYNEYLNLELDEFMQVIDHALENGCSLVWDGDNSERSYSHQQGVAILPKKEWYKRTAMERANICKIPEKEKKVDQKFRQESYDNYNTTDDHLMHIIGRAEDQNGTTFYKAKNSWGAESNKYGGYIYLSESYMRSKTISVMLHKDGLPPRVAKLVQKIHNN